MNFYDAPQYIILGADGDNADGDDAVREGFEGATDGRTDSTWGQEQSCVFLSFSAAASLHPPPRAYFTLVEVESARALKRSGVAKTNSINNC